MVAVLPPYSGSVVSVKAIDAGHIDWLPSHLFFSPAGLAAYGSPDWMAPIYAFLIEHVPKDSDGALDRVMFDLGIRKDQDALPPRVVKGYATWSKGGAFVMRVDQDVSERLTTAGIPLESVGAVIWRYCSFLTCLTWD